MPINCLLMVGCTDHWSRFSIKQTTKDLRPKRSFTPHHSSWGTLDLRGNIHSDHKTPLHDPQSIPHGWEWYEIGFFIHWTPPHNTKILCFDLPEHMQMSLRSALMSSANTDLSDPYSIFSVIFYQVLTLYDNSVWSIRNHICNWESVRLRLPLKIPLLILIIVDETTRPRLSSSA